MNVNPMMRQLLCLVIFPFIPKKNTDKQRDSENTGIESIALRVLLCVCL